MNQLGGTDALPSTVLGVGIDLVENKRMKETLEQWGTQFKNRVFTPAEQAYCDKKSAPWRHYAGRFAVKESVSKAFGTGIGKHVGWLDIEVTRNPDTGAPVSELRGKAKALADQKKVHRVLVSLSHTHDFAIAQAVLVGSQSEV